VIENWAALVVRIERLQHEHTERLAAMCDRSGDHMICDQGSSI
jgi:hypothetical protein